LAQYLFNCENDGEMTLELKMSEIKEEMICPICNGKLKRIYSPTASVWKCGGDYNSTR
jgi:predicted nucleic acid-binding Zn ribbon protein